MKNVNKNELARKKQKGSRVPQTSSKPLRSQLSAEQVASIRESLPLRKPGEKARSYRRRLLRRAVEAANSGNAPAADQILWEAVIYNNLTRRRVINRALAHKDK